MSRFFNEVEFDDPNDDFQKLQKRGPRVIWDKDKLKKAYEEISHQISKIKNGTSDYTVYAVNPGSFGFPADNAIKIFISDPSDKAFEGVLEICRQDFGAKAGNHFHSLLKEARREETNE